MHVPFCRLVCAYCDFVTVAGRREDIPRYVGALLRELRARPATGHLATIYFGGGTPSLLPAHSVTAIVDAAVAHWPGAVLEEVTLEANPSTREAPDWAALRAAGVTRISLGVQSLDDDDLQALARGHTADEAATAFRAARAAGFDNVSIDLIYGIPGQTLDRWRRTLARAIALRPDHVSLYGLQLALAPDEWAATPRPGALKWRRRMAALQDDDAAAHQYSEAARILEAAGYAQYELSSWALPGRQSRHNLAYWQRHAYTGIGAGAHSYDGVARRWWNHRDLDRYLADVEGTGTAVEGLEQLDTRERAFEAIALGLRRVTGLSRAAFAAEFGRDPADFYPDAVGQGVAAGLLEQDPAWLRLTASGRLLASEALVGFAG